MIYALISDVHGNLDALQAVLDDARGAGVSHFFLLGDYVADFPYPNEVVEAILGLHSATVVRGNKEDYLTRLRDAPPGEPTHEQFAAVYWNARALRPDHLAYLCALPREKTLRIEDQVICLSHNMGGIAGEYGPFMSDVFTTNMLRQPFTHAQYLREIERAVYANPAMLRRLDELPDGVYACGHTHLQWHAHIGGKVLINAGSCGLPLDFDQRAPYTLLEHTPQGWRVEERRVAYDAERTDAALLRSPLYQAARVWCEVIRGELLTAHEHVDFFLRFVERMAQGRGDARRPYGDALWREAGAAWDTLDRLAWILTGEIRQGDTA